MRKSWMLICLCLGIVLTASTSCADKPKSLNPNGDSELALLMRAMHEEGMQAKQQLLKGETPALKVNYHQLHTAKATEPEKVATPTYASFATAYEAAAKSFEEGSDKVGTYHNMVNACMNCHKEICPGPMVKIKKMYLSDKEIASIQ
jgi:ribosomal protein L44E